MDWSAAAIRDRQVDALTRPLEIGSSLNNVLQFHLEIVPNEGELDLSDRHPS
jgi:hypothetical protein